MEQKLISVIVPIYNVEKYLSKCIDSILNQTYINIEILLIDDGSTDNCGSICEKYKIKDSRIKVIHKANGGLSNARNYGLDNSKGSYICFVDSDDYLEPTYLEELKNNIDYYESDISICNFNYHNYNRITTSSYKILSFCSEGKEKYVNLQNEFGGLTVIAWNKLYKREIFNNIRYPDGKIFEDSYIICDLLDNAQKISYILKPLYNYVCRKESIANSFTLNHFNKIDSYDKIIESITKKGFYDLIDIEKNRKMNCLIINLSKMKRYGIKNNEMWNMYYKKLVEINKEVKWKTSTKYNKLYKLFRRRSINILACILRVRDLIRK